MTHVRPTLLALALLLPLVSSCKTAHSIINGIYSLHTDGLTIEVDLDAGEAVVLSTGTSPYARVTNGLKVGDLFLRNLRGVAGDPDVGDAQFEAESVAGVYDASGTLTGLTWKPVKLTVHTNEEETAPSGITMEGGDPNLPSFSFRGHSQDGGGGGGADGGSGTGTTWKDTWVFVQGDKAVQMRMGLKSVQGTVHTVRIQYRVNSSDSIYCAQCNGYHVAVLTDGYNYRVDFPASFKLGQVYELQRDFVLDLQGGARWDATAMRARASDGNIYFPHSCVDDNSTRSRCSYELNQVPAGNVFTAASNASP